MSKFSGILEKAVAAEKAVRELQHDRQAWRLCASAYLREALALARCDEKRLDEIEDAIADRPHDFDALERYLVRVARASLEWNMSAPSLRGMVGLSSEQSDSEAAALRATKSELLAIVIRRLTRSNPDWFGTAAVQGEAKERLDDLIRDRDRAFRAVEVSWTAADVVVEDAKPHPRVVLKATGTTVGKDMVEQAVNVLLSRDGRQGPTRSRQM
jgi:hypothetical protein